LENSIATIIKQVKIPIKDYEVIIAEDGSTDGSDKLALKLSKKFQNVRCICSRRRKGKGRAIKNAFKTARGELLAFMDVDLSSDPVCLPKMLKSLESGADIAIGSRHLAGSKVKRGVVRSLASKSYNYLARALFSTRINDMQCGFKAFRRSMLPVLLSAKSDGFFWDTEVLLTAEASGACIAEVPISWRENKKSKLKLVKDAFEMGISLIRLRTRLRPVNITSIISKDS